MDVVPVPAAKVYFPEEDRKAILEKINDSLTTGMLTLNKYTKEFEQNFANYTGTKYAIATNSGTSALEIIVRAHRLGGKTVIVPTNTFFATPAAVLHAGANVKFADVGKDLCITPDAVRKAIDKDTKAVYVVHIGGVITPGIEEIREICEEKGLYLFEDAAHAHGSTYKGKKAGTFGAAAGFSFYPTKVMTSGEGGMITTNDEEIYKRALIFRDQGKQDFSSNYHIEMGYTWRMCEVCAAIGIHQLARLDEFIAARRRVAKVYDEEFANAKGVSAMEIPPGSMSNYYKYCAILDKKPADLNAMKKKLKENYKVGLSGEVYTVPCHLQPVFKEKYGFKGGEFPVAEDLCSRHICPPVFVTMTDDQARRVVSSLNEVLAQAI